jgi:ABC-type nitrate/sulfonate/bicarbonate transport system substrate-binding protein
MLKTIALAALFALLVVPHPAAADDALTIMQGSSALPLYSVADVVAERAGFFKAEHLVVTQQIANSPSTAAALVASGKGDLCSVSAQAILQGYEKGLRLVYFLAHAARYSNVMAVLDDSPIRTLADFKGKNIGISQIGGDGEVTGRFILSGAGLGPSDYSYSPIGFGPQAIQAIVSKQVDGVVYPFVEVVPIEVTAHVKMRVFRHPIVNDIANSGFATTAATLATKGDAMRRYARAIVKASIFVRYNPHVAALFFLQAQGVRVTPEAIADKARAFVLLRDDLLAADPASRRIGYMEPRGLEVLSRVLNSYGLTKAVTPGSAIVTNDYIGFANDFDRPAVIAMAKHYHLTPSGEAVP